VTDWRAWHEQYDGDLQGRLLAVQDVVRDWLDTAPAGRLRVTCACAGDGRDLGGVVPTHPRGRDVDAVLVELDEELADRASATFPTIQGDAGELSTYLGLPPADLLLCGIFGNVSDEDVRNTVRHASRLCAFGATVVWTRHRRRPDLTDSIRAWFAEEGWAEEAFLSAGPDSWSVGVARLTVEPLPFEAPLRLFTFTR
jgi:hypothetical protein